MTEAPVEHAALAALVDDVDEAVIALGVAGVAFPDPDLPGDLRRLEDRTRRAGLSVGADRVAALAAAVEVLQQTHLDQDRRRLGSEAFEALQGLVTWLRSFRTALSLEVVKARLSRAAADEAQVQRRGEDLDVWPLGAEEAGTRLQIHALAADGTWIVLVDERREVSPHDPLRTPAVSRLFQDRVALSDVLGARVELRDHPLARAGHRTLARPAFHTRPQLAEVGEGAPEVRRGALDPALGPVGITLQVRSREDGWGFTAETGPVTVTLTPHLSRALARRCAWEGEPLSLDAVVLARGSAVVVLQWLDVDGEPAWPTLDPAGARVSVDELSRRLGESEAASLARGALAASGLDLGDVEPVSSDELGLGFRAGALAVLRGGAPAPVAAARVLLERGVAGEDTFGLLWPAVWCVLECDGVAPHLEALAALRAARLAVPLASEDDWDEVCLRARLHHALSEPEGSVPAGAAFLEAHLATLRRRAGTGVVPEPLVLWSLADTRSVIRDTPRTVGCGRELGLPLDPVRDLLDAHLLPWVAAGEAADTEVLDVLLAMACFDLSQQWWR